jgi:hypothetical protein
MSYIILYKELREDIHKMWYNLQHIKLCKGPVSKYVNKIAFLSAQIPVTVPNFIKIQ